MRLTLAFALCMVVARMVPAQAGYSYVKIQNKQIGGNNCVMSAYDSNNAAWLTSSKYSYASLADCEELCSAQSSCAAFVDNREASPVYCIFKTSTVTNSNTAKDTYVRQGTCPYTKQPDTSISGNGCDMSAYDSSNANWRGSGSYYYTSLSDCDTLCSAQSTCLAYVDRYDANPTYCVFKASIIGTTSYSDRDFYVKQASCTGQQRQHHGHLQRGEPQHNLPAVIIVNRDEEPYAQHDLRPDITFVDRVVR
ncbi:hypothetical protein CYMTET_9331 [Cymbomonas tetramitiformis]|uniref:Apple domain-containing protein n=1 Tax=Cymbomonas tetramitiformis TaxID=36881 RepID=A0AAE0GSZ9_9CHLO|nr:hypothetical protein CYMTET_9331 [Cymbomonas tetramitiformis]